ncbi:extracellular solute-binding protein [Sporolactobacillus shoreicorticis]|uniref:Extracellular solute-binding protein n=1 Tax=Sporolactobacillus shoreicorticis TaxID=1923877 RepID=A0ABW5RZN8_9BACL|nr:extracellular solute-binding protein [Sporolactobacillus shoreicorticis]MCO7124801.1 extracellular solute-binding protein [Sporolactobacillus shoreicorticis]
MGLKDKKILREMEKLKRLMLRMMILVLALSVLGGCASGADGDTSKSGKVKIDYWYGLGSAAGKKMKQIIAEFNATHKNIEVVGVSQPDYTTTYQKLQASITSGNAPGIALLDAGSMNDLGKKKVLESLDSYISSDKSMKSDDFLPVFTKPAEIGGKTYGLPAYGTTQVTYFRKDIFKKAGGGY